MARVTRLELATSGVTGRHSNQLSYTRITQKANLPDGDELRPNFREVKQDNPIIVNNFQTKSVSVEMPHIQPSFREFTCVRCRCALPAQLL